ncbi:ABC transporter substrate-binding protein [Falsiroseomonas sp. HW251]|uniref:ABC transporter substrate-binding protein n=1 Tax=Falsiroseomonas sp. HW251 TaxID=3390998 RepID=UPI003D31F9EC
MERGRAIGGWQVGRRGLGLALGAALARPALAQAPADLRLGAIFPLSGPLALLGDESYRGLELAVEERNAAGGVFGRPLRLLRADATDEASGAAEARRLVGGNDRVAAIFGSFSTAVALAGSQVAEAAGVPWLELGAVGDQLTERGFRWVFRVSPAAADYAATAIEAVTEVLARAQGVAPTSLRLGIAHDEGPGGTSVGTAQEEMAKARGLTVVERVGYAPRPSDLGALVQRLRGQDAEVLLHTGGPADEILLFRALRDAGWRPRMVIGTGNGYGLTETARSLGDAILGTMSADLTPFAVNERFAPGARAFADTYLRRYGAEPRSGHGLAAHVGAKLFLDALQRAGGVEKDKLRAAILGLDVAEATTATGWGARFDERGQNQRAKPVLCQWQQGQHALRQVVIAPAAAAVADAMPRLG